MKKFDLKTLIYNAIIAALYAVLTLGLAPISYGSIQMRISEVLVFLAFYNKKYIPGLVLGCFIANMASPLGLWDVGFGTLATLLAVVSISYLPNKYLGALSGALFNGVIVGAELTILFKELPFYLNCAYVFIGELAVLIIGAIIFNIIDKNESIKHILEMK